MNYWEEYRIGVWLIGLIGGFFAAFHESNMSKRWWEKIMIVFAGGLMAALVATPVGDLLGLNEMWQNFAAFVIGYLGMQIIDYLASLPIKDLITELLNLKTKK